ncbi:7158_t:CDS:2, partial [Funneliformis geosporum]
IATVDPDLLDSTVRRFTIENKLKETMPSKNISELREIFMEVLIKVSVNLPGHSDEDEEWESSLNPWVTRNRASTKMPEDYEKYVDGIAFLDRFEIVRILKPFGPVEPTDNLWNKIKIKCGVAIHEVLHEECKQYYLNRSNVNIFTEMPKLINKNLIHVWALSLKEFPPAGPRAHVLFSGDVVLKDRHLVLTLHPPKIGTSKRYYRLLSSERFLHLKINMDFNVLNNKQKASLKNLLLCPLSLAGRKYEFLYAKSETLYYFATSGSDLSNMSIREVIDCNLPIELNKKMNTAKFYSRISLGFSNSTPSIVFKPNEIRYNVEDITMDNHCFTDGCAAISLVAMKEVSEILGLEETPSAIQGRIGGAKGIWYIEPLKDNSGNKWIELRRSQIKYNVKQNSGVDDTHLRTLEVLRVVVPPRTPGTLNSQFIRVLYNGGVPVEVFLKIMKDYLDKIKYEVVDCDDPYSLIAWVTNVSKVMKKRLEVFNHFEDDYSDDGSNYGDLSVDLGFDGCVVSGFPNSPAEQCIQMLQAGFIPSTCPFLAKKLKLVLMNVLRSLCNKFRIELPLSRVLICIADPTRTLKPGEIFIQLDKESGRDERTGLPFGIIEDEVILARNPSVLPSDIVKVKAVKNMHLSIYFNVVIFPVNAERGDVSLATHISGGDYDGDKEVIIDNYFKGLEPILGLYDRWHKLQSSRFGISDKQSIYLAQMCAQLVDSTKQGLTIKPSVRQSDNELCGKLPVPYWMDKERFKTKPNSGDNFGVTNVMDLLCITIEKETNEVNSKEFSVAKVSQDLVDTHINEFWRNEFVRTQYMEEGSAYKEDLNLIANSMSELVQMYNKKCANIYQDDQDRKEIEQSSSKSALTTNYSRLNDEFKGVDYEFLNEFLNSPSIEDYKSSVFKVLKDRTSTSFETSIDPLAIFELQLKAASLYLSSVEKKVDGQVCWVIAFRILCNIKSQMVESDQSLVIGGPRTIIDEVWQALRIDKKWLKRKKINPL